jgi:hypothetical protein
MVSATAPAAFRKLAGSIRRGKRRNQQAEEKQQQRIGYTPVHHAKNTLKPRSTSD